MFCTRCGTEYTDGSPYCTACGPKPEDFGLTPQEADFLAPTNSGVPTDMSDSWLYWVGGALGVGVVYSVLQFFRLGEWRGYGENPWHFAYVLGFFAGFALIGNGAASALARLRRSSHERFAQKHQQYPNYLKYQAAIRHYSGLCKARRNDERQIKRAAQEELRKSIAWWKSLDGPSFERELVVLFADRGYAPRWTGRYGADGGVDITLSKNGKTVIVQCKAYRHYVGPAPVRELYGTLVHTKADEAWLIASSGYWSGAARFAQGKPIRLFNIRQILEGRESEGRQFS